MNSERQNWMILLLGIAIIFMSFVTLGGFLLKNPLAKESDKTEFIPPLVANDDLGDKLKDLGSNVNNNLATVNEKLDNMDKKISKISTRLWLMSVIQNENTNLIIQSYRMDPGFIYFDENWKLNKLPRTMQMDADTKMKLENHTKHKSG